MNSGSSMLPYPVYIGASLSHGAVIPPQQLQNALHVNNFRPPVLPPKASVDPQLAAVSNYNASGISITLHVCLFSNEGPQTINSPNQTIVHLEPLSRPSIPANGFTLSVDWTSHLVLHTLGKDFKSSDFTIPRDVWHKFTFVFSLRQLLVVSVNGRPIITVPEETVSALSSTASNPTEAQETGTKANELKWPFGALFIGNTGLKPTQLGSISRDWLNSLCHGAISGLDMMLHSFSELSTLRSLCTPSTAPSTSTSIAQVQKEYSSFASAPVEVLAALGTLATALSDSPAPNFVFPPESFPLPSRICRPLFSVEEMNNWEEYLCAFSKLKLTAFKPIPIQPRTPHSGPTVLLCHDYRGGYFHDAAWERSPLELRTEGQEDQNTEMGALRVETPDGKAHVILSSFVPDVYTFSNWSYIDIFTYFTHARVSIPPVATIQAAHMNGVEVLGTLITEWEAGYLDTKRLLAGKNGDKMFYAKILIDIATTLSFEGWLVNIEHSMSPEEVIELVAWMKQFKVLSNEKKQKIVWYDSVIKSGELKWQSALNENNIMFFDACDLFFTDYHWKLSNLETSLLASQGNPGKVLMGVDVWGRGSYGGGGWNTTVALKAITRTGNETSDSSTSDSDDPLIRKFAPQDSSSPDILLQDSEPTTGKTESKLSFAIFAPGWTLESQADSFDSLYRNEARYWRGVDQWNIFSQQFQVKLDTYFRLYWQDKEDGVDFSVDDILSPFGYSEDGTAWAAERQAAAYSSTTPNSTSGRFPNLPEIFDPRTGGSQWSWRHIKFNISDTVITSEYMDRQPEITLSVWFKGNSAPFRVRVLLLDAKDQLIADFDSGILKGTPEWKQMHYVWRDYGIGVRTILWLDGTRDSANWAGFYGCTIDRPSVLIANPKPIESVSTYVKPRKLKISKFPFVSSFDLGQGTSLFSDGSPIQYNLPTGELWYNLASQSPIPSLSIEYEQLLQSSGPLSPPAIQTSISSRLQAFSATERRTLSAEKTKIIKFVSARIVDASSIDGGVWQGSSCLKIESSLSSPEALSGASKSSPRNSQGEIDLTTSSSPPVSSTLSMKKKRSSLKLLFESAKLQSPSEQANISLYPLSIDAPGSQMTIKFVCRSIQIPKNCMVLVLVTRIRKSTKEHLEPLSWDLLSTEHRDPGAPSSLGWIHFISSWLCEEDIEYTGVNLGILAVQFADLLGSSSTNSPRSPRKSVAATFSQPSLKSSSSGSLPSSDSISALSRSNSTSTPKSSRLELLIGFMKLEEQAASREGDIPTPPPSGPVSLRRDSLSNPLALDYKLTWSTKSIFADTPVYDLTAYWKVPEVPPHLAHLGPPHFIITATLAQQETPDAPATIHVLAQGRTWNSSWVITGLHAAGDLTFTVNTVYPDYSSQAHLTDRVQITWPVTSTP